MTLTKREIGKFVDGLVVSYGAPSVALVLDAFKDIGFRFATQAGITISKNDVVTPPDKQQILARYEGEVGEIQSQYDQGLITLEERHEKVVDTWQQASEEVAAAMEANLHQLNPIYMMANSGARGSFTQIRQLAGMRGLMANPKGEIIERPIKASFMEGLTVLEYFISTHGARKGLADTALRTADSGYLTRRLVDVAQDVIVRIEDCKTRGFIEMPLHKEGGAPNDNLVGRVAAQKLTTKRGRVLLQKNELIDRDQLSEIVEAHAGEEDATVPVRSVLKCEAEAGVCGSCYGVALATGAICDLGDAVGIVAAQSIGEPGTQLTMRTFHTGGVAGADITHGLPRVVELFEARKPKGVAQITNVAGTAAIEDLEKERKITILDSKGEEHLFRFPRRTRLLVEHGDKVDKGRQLNEGSLYPAELLEIRGRDETERYLVREVQEVYKSQGVDINDKHIELIVRQMLKRVRIEKKGGTGCLPGSLVDRHALKRMNDALKKSKGEAASAEEVILGITKASLATDSFLSAASFQETTKVLTDAALEGKVDRLLGLKENVIIGKLIPAATGLKHYRTLEIEPTEPIARPSADEIGLLDEEQLAAELGLDGEGLEGLGADITGDFGDDFGADFDMANGEGAQRAAKDGDEG
jgi:DNA-directed RNA polymerase subunit beta'